MSQEPLLLAWEAEDWPGAAYVLQGLGSLHQQAGRFEESMSCLVEGLACWDKAEILNDLGIA